MIGVDWGTTSFRTFRFAPDGSVLDRRVSARGIMNVPDATFAETLRDEIGSWLADGEDRVLLSGMIGSRQGWKEAPYLRCPAGADELSRALIEVRFEGAKVRLVPGLSGVDESGVAEVMRGEETQVLGASNAMGGAGIACLPGTHSKWVRVEAGRITGFTTHMTGEVYATLRDHTILGRMMSGDLAGGAPFDAGVRRSGEPGGMLHHIFGTRALTLAGQLAETEGAAYLSGILIGHELRAALAGLRGQTMHVIGAPDLTALYARAIGALGYEARCHEAGAAERGLAMIGEHAVWD